MVHRQAIPDHTMDAFFEWKATHQTQELEAGELTATAPVAV